MVVTRFDGVRVHRRVSAAQVLAPPLVCDGKQQRLDSQAVGSILISQRSYPSNLSPPHTQRHSSQPVYDQEPCCDATVPLVPLVFE